MIPQLKALVVVFAVSFGVLVFFRKPFADILGGRNYNIWAMLWLLTALSVFLIPNYWLFVCVLSLLGLALSQGAARKPATFAMLVIAVPSVGLSIPGFLGINRFIETTPQTFLIASLLLPTLLIGRHVKKTSNVSRTTDIFFLCWLVLQCVLALRAPSVTHMVRLILESFIAIAPIYYVFSRHPKTLADIRITATLFVLATIMISIMTIPETVMTWHFYTDAAAKWGIDINFAYKLRSGVLRATGSTSNPIVWGFIAMSAFGIALAIANERLKGIFKLSAFGTLGAGLLASMSRGPWIGAAATVVIFVLTGPKKFGAVIRLSVVGVLGGAIAAATPYGQKVINLLPFLGGDASDTISYRQRLLDASLAVISENPLFGSQNYLSHPRMQAMRQGEGIIDIVNSYIQVALQSGFVGLFIYLGVFLSVLFNLRKAYISANQYDTGLALYCRAYFATLVGIMLTLFTTSTVEHMSYVIWMLLGGGVALTRIEHETRHKPQTDDNIKPEPTPQTAPQFDWK